MPASISSRHKFYKANKTRFSKVFCFGNIPPTVKLDVPVYTYFQNLILIRQVKETSARERFMLRIKSRFISLHRRKTDHFIVQSESIKKELCAAYRLHAEKVLVIPFYEEHVYEDTAKVPGQFLYVSEGYEHKNHLRLLEAWKLVSRSRPELSLHLTVSPAYPNLQMQIAAMKDSGINITNHGSVNRAELRQLYASSPYLIYPSLIESFGLGLVEAYEAGCEILAADLPYVHAILDPLKTFDPLSAQSIAAAALKTPATTNTAALTTHLKIKNGINTLLDIFAAK
jgi:glycosyltransferase involved in cell wall biosynthesis